ncbi:GPW/gp25 family protein [Actinoplanes sp. NEAU-A12]|uniref:GPW/gp25 family protein n=1 Tax=Actinoplanes sandaracinus TaxID=3045177 RepID=A0ABT6WWM5_9ACTN|nr:GPW/gp25 family protein [Actinoplanes sandaracinus]MDI6104125.1 GPW/gp25 family protein [Actinoplanes sandaracinus]
MRRPVSDSVRFPFAIDPEAGRLAQEPDYAAHVDQLIRQVLLTGPGERVNRPDFGCGLRRMVFAPNSTATASLLRVMVLEALERWLAGVITVDHVRVVASDALLDVTVAYVINARGERRFLNLAVAP